ncbi:RNase H1/viroplasmin domain-containing protein [Aspergillus foveolatus]|uniref:RNase H1/viroplasmin domain-containing protein n=1 Tax=Aspergillus foveolatus TaxID=210207 RepID=UPI003CCCF18E
MSHIPLISEETNAHIFTGFMFMGAAISLWLVRAWKTSELQKTAAGNDPVEREAVIRDNDAVPQQPVRDRTFSGVPSVASKAGTAKGLPMTVKASRESHSFVKGRVPPIQSPPLLALLRTPIVGSFDILMSRKNYYAIYKGRVDRPTIVSSWAQAHPRVEEFNGADHEGFDTLEDARNSMQKRGFSEFSEVIKGNQASKTVLRPAERFYAVAYGISTGVFRNYDDVKKATDNFKSACHQRFNTQDEAEQFIEQWRLACSEVWQREIRKALQNGWLLNDLSFKSRS